MWLGGRATVGTRRHCKEQPGAKHAGSPPESAAGLYLPRLQITMQTSQITEQLAPQMKELTENWMLTMKRSWIRLELMRCVHNRSSAKAAGLAGPCMFT